MKIVFQFQGTLFDTEAEYAAMADDDEKGNIRIRRLKNMCGGIKDVK